MKRVFRASLIAFFSLIAVVFLHTMQASPTINQLYVFGDSLSDVGTVFQATGGIYPPKPSYFQGRYSNGRVWVEYLTEQLQLSPTQMHNFAWGGATTGRIAVADRPSLNDFVPDLLTQVQTFTRSHPQPDAHALFVVWAGANDYLQGVRDASVPVANLMQAIAALMQTGANKILVGNLPDLGQLPATRTGANATPLNALTQAHNQGLRRSLKQLSQQHGDCQLALLDANTLYREAIANPTKFGLRNVTSACLNGTGACPNPSQFLFWDGIHPTTAAHQILGETAFATVQATPMPNTTPMLLP